jgi:cyclophilin family peptidyl-prolyl cis-trans isomerase
MEYDLFGGSVHPVSTCATCSHVVFGKLVEGMEVLDALEAVGSPSGRPQRPVEVVDCGELAEQK